MCDKDDYFEICKILVNQINLNRDTFHVNHIDDHMEKPLVFVDAKGLPIIELEELNFGIQGAADSVITNEDGTKSFIDFKTTGFNSVMPERKNKR